MPLHRDRKRFARSAACGLAVPVGRRAPAAGKSRAEQDENARHSRRRFFHWTFTPDATLAGGWRTIDAAFIAQIRALLRCYPCAPGPGRPGPGPVEYQVVDVVPVADEAVCVCLVSPSPTG